MDKKTIVVCGATGQQGGAVVNALLKRNQYDIVALSRDPDGSKSQALKEMGVRIVSADLRNKISLVKAFQGVDMVFGVTQPFSADYKKSDPRGEIEQGYNIIDSCIETGIKHLVLSTVFSIDKKDTGVAHVDSKTTIVNYLRNTKLNYIILKPASLMDNIGKSFFPVKKGVIRGYTAKDVKIPYIAIKDIGEFAAIVFEQPNLYSKREINLMGDLISGEDLAKTMSKIRNGEPFKYTSVPRLIMWLFAREFYEMRVAFEKAGRPPYPEEYTTSLRTCLAMHPEIMNMEKYLLSQGYDVKQL